MTYEKIYLIGSVMSACMNIVAYEEFEDWKTLFARQIVRVFTDK